MAVNGHEAVERPVNPVDSRGPGDDHDLLLIDASERIVYADGPSVGRTADSAEGVVGLHVAEVLSPRLPAGALRDCREALAGHTSASTFESLEGDEVWSFSATPVTGDAGDVVAAVAVMRRITDDASRRRGGAGPRRGPWSVTRDAPVTGVVIERARTVLVGDGPGASMVDAAPVARGAMLHRLAGRPLRWW